MPTMAATALPWPPWCPTSGAEAYNNQPTCYTIVYVVKTRIKDTYYYYFHFYVHDALTRMMCLQVTMPAATYRPSAVVPMQ